MVSKDTNTHEAPALDVTLLGILSGMWWKLLWRWWARLPASYISEEKTVVLGTSLFRNLFLVRRCAVRPACGTYPECDIGRESGRQVTDPVRIYLTRYPSALAEKSGSFPVFFRYSLVLILPLAPQQLTSCVRPPPLRLLRKGSWSEIRVDPDKTLA